MIERHYVSMRSRRQKSVLVSLAQDTDGHAFLLGDNCICAFDMLVGARADGDGAGTRGLEAGVTIEARAVALLNLRKVSSMLIQHTANRLRERRLSLGPARWAGFPMEDPMSTGGAGT